MTDPAPPLQILQSAAEGPSLGLIVKTYEENFNISMFKFVVFTIIQTLILYFVFAGSGIAEITKNWPKYRCNPMIMPFASLFGYDATENFNYCMKNIFSANAGTVLAPLYGIMANFTEVVGTVSNVANSFRLLIANLLHGMERLMSSFRDRFRTILFSIRTSFMKIQSLMGRVYATFYAVVFMGLSALKAADNVAHNDLVTFMMEFCFLPDTPIMLEDGVVLPLSMIKIGDRLAPVNGEVPIVTSLFMFDGSKTSMVRIGETVVSAKHYIYYPPLKTWIEAGEHPYATVEPSSPILFCLNTSSHELRIGQYIFSDYDESSNPTVAREVQILAEKLLNNGRYSEPRTKDYVLGLDGNSVVRMRDCTIRPIKSIHPGDFIKGGGRVLGIVRESCDKVVRIPGLSRPHYVSASQLLWHANTNRWRRACDVYPERVAKMRSPRILCHLITENNIIYSEGQVYRDYREVSDPAMEEPYAEELSTKIEQKHTVSWDLK